MLLCVSVSLRQAAVDCQLLLPLLLKVCLLAGLLLAAPAPDLTFPAVLYQHVQPQLKQQRQQLLSLQCRLAVAAAAAVVPAHLLCFAGLCVEAGLDPPAAAAAVVD